MPDKKNRLVAVVGPTGIGKSRLAMHLAVLYNGEIISADSRQIYRYMDIGTDKPRLEDLSRVPHHLIDVADPDEDFSLACYQEMAGKAIAAVQERGRLPFLVGGSGLYVWSVIEGWQIPRVLPDNALRKLFEKRAGEEGGEALYRELEGIDPAAARKIDPRNIRRVIRALEVHDKTSKAFSELGSKKAPPFDVFIIGLTATREEIYRRADRRVDEMLARGFVSEVENLLKMGYDLRLSAMSGIGYRQIAGFLKGDLAMAAACQQIKTGTHRFIRHQYAWFRLKDARIHWFDVQAQSEADIAAALAGFLNSD